MRLSPYFFCLLCLLGLSGCIHDASRDERAKPLNVAQLTIPDEYRIPRATSITNTSGWWQRFHDPILNQLIDVALQDAPTVKIAANRLSRAQAYTDKAAAKLWPSAELSGSLQRERFAKFGLVPPPFNGGTFNIGEIGVNFNYELDFWGKNRETLAAKISEACARDADLAQARLILSTSVAANYFQLQYYLAEWQNAKAVVKQRRELSRIIRYRAAHGIVSDIPVKTAHADVQAAVQVAERYKAWAQLSRDQLAYLLGQNALATKISVKPFAASAYRLRLPASLPAHLLANRPDILATRFRTVKAAHEINVAKAYFFPDINLIGLFSYQSIKVNRLLSAYNQNNLFGGTIDLPIFDAGARRANLNARYAEYDMAVNQYNQRILLALREVADQLATWQMLSAQHAAEEQALQAIAHNYKLTRSRYHHGIVGYYEVLDSEGYLLQQRASHIDISAQQLLNLVATIKALGGQHIPT